MDPNLKALPAAEPPAEETLSWEDTYAIARALLSRHANIALEQVSLEMVYHWTLELAGFHDDPELANEEILSAIFQEWFEEANPL